MKMVFSFSTLVIQQFVYKVYLLDNHFLWETLVDIVIISGGSSSSIIIVSSNNSFQNIKNLVLVCKNVFVFWPVVYFLKDKKRKNLHSNNKYNIHKICCCCFRNQTIVFYTFYFIICRNLYIHLYMYIVMCCFYLISIKLLTKLLTYLISYLTHLFFINVYLHCTYFGFKLGIINAIIKLVTDRI